MNIRYLGLVIVALVGITIACGSVTQKYELVVVTTTPVGAISQEPQGKVGDKVTQRDFSVTVTAIEEASAYGQDMPKPGNTFIAVEVMIESETDRGIDLVGVSARLQDADGEVYVLTFGGKRPFFKPVGNAKKGTLTQGWTTFEVPVEARGFIFIYEPAFSNQRAVIDLGK